MMSQNPIKAGITYFALIFALGFVLGTLRVLWLAPLVGEHGAVLAELPVMLAASYLAARRLTIRHRITDIGGAALMGGLAFALLMLAEISLARTLSGTAITDWFSALFAAPGAYGLAGQMAFGMMPMAVRQRN